MCIYNIMKVFNGYVYIYIYIISIYIYINKSIYIYIIGQYWRYNASKSRNESRGFYQHIKQYHLSSGIHGKIRGTRGCGIESAKSRARIKRLSWKMRSASKVEPNTSNCDFNSEKHLHRNSENNSNIKSQRSERALGNGTPKTYANLWDYHPSAMGEQHHFGQ